VKYCVLHKLQKITHIRVWIFPYNQAIPKNCRKISLLKESVPKSIEMRAKSKKFLKSEQQQIPGHVKTTRQLSNTNPLNLSFKSKVFRTTHSNVEHISA
jgi:hypothetical protein